MPSPADSSCPGLRAACPLHSEAWSKGQRSFVPFFLDGVVTFRVKSSVDGLLTRWWKAQASQALAGILTQFLPLGHRLIPSFLLIFLTTASELDSGGCSEGQTQACLHSSPWRQGLCLPISVAPTNVPRKDLARGRNVLQDFPKG